MKKKTYSIMESQHNLSKVLREVAQGYEVGITNRKKLVARVLPVENGRDTKFPDFVARARALCGDTKTDRSAQQLLDEVRGDY